MTDSGSFDSGDLIYAADIGNLTTLINAKCAEAGVTASPYVAADFVVGNPIDAASHNDLIAAYQRAWDASSNKPGTRQSAVSQGGTMYGALYQNMWTQLNQMTFADVTPDANTFYCPMSNATNNGNETGSGGGLSGSDLTLTCNYSTNGGVEGLSSGTRRVWGTGYLDTTITFADAFLQGRTTYTWMCKLYDWQVYANSLLCGFYDGSRHFNIQRANTSGNVAVRINGFGLDVLTNFPSAPPSTGPVYFAFVRNGTLFKVGWSTSMFTSWSGAASTLEWTGNTVTFGSVASRRYILGHLYSAKTNPNFKAAWVAMSKSALVS